MNDAERKRAAALLGKAEDEITVSDLLDLADSFKAKDEQNRFEASLRDGKEKLTGHVARRAIPTAALDTAMAEVEKAETADEREAIVERYSAAWTPIPDKTISSNPKGSTEASQEEEEEVDKVLASAKVAEFVAEIRAKNPGIDPYDLHQAAVARLTDEEREEYENEETTVGDYQRGR